MRLECFVNKYSVFLGFLGFVLILSVLAYGFADSPRGGDKTTIPAEQDSVAPDQTPEQAAVSLAREFVDLIATYRHEWAHRQFKEATQYLSASGRSEFKRRMIKSELEWIKNRRQSQMFFVNANLVRLKRTPFQNRVLVEVPGICQKLLGIKPLAPYKMVYEIALSISSQEGGAEPEVLITGFKQRRGTVQADGEKDSPQTQKMERAGHPHLPLNKVPEEAFAAVAQRFVSLVGNYQPSIALGRFAAAQRYLADSARPEFEERIVSKEIGPIEKNRLSQMFFINHALTKSERISEEDTVTVTLTGIAQEFMWNQPLSPRRMSFVLSMNTSSERADTPYGIVIAKADWDERAAEKLETADPLEDVKLDLDLVKLKLREYIVGGSEAVKDIRKAQLRQMYQEKRQRQQAGRLFAKRRKDILYFWNPEELETELRFITPLPVGDRGGTPEINH